MPSRRRVLAICSSGLGVVAGCVGARTRPEIPREATILDERATIEPGAYRAWSLTERVRNAGLSPVDGAYVFSHEFTVEQGSAVKVAVTSTESLGRRAETGGNYKVFAGTDAYGQHGHASELMDAALLDVLVTDNQYIGPDTPPTDRSAATVHVKAYLSRPESSRGR